MTAKKSRSGFWGLLGGFWGAFGLRSGGLGPFQLYILHALIKPVSPQGAQLGFHYICNVHIIRAEMRFFEDLVMDTDDLK